MKVKMILKLALDYYSKALKIYQQAVSTTHPELIQTENGIKRCKSKLK